MNALTTTILAVQMLSAVGLIGLILVQHGKGADMGAAFGSGSSGSLFGASGSANFLSRTTAVLAAVFFACTLALAYFGNTPARKSSGGSVLDGAAVTAPVPAVSAPAPTGAGQIPSGGNQSAAPQPASTAVATPAPAPAASGVGQIPSK